MIRKQLKNDSTNTFQRIPVLTSWGSQIPRQSQHNLMANQDLCQMSGLDLRYKLHGRLDHTVEQTYFYLTLIRLGLFGPSTTQGLESAGKTF